jgi:hypothetical protein
MESYILLNVRHNAHEIDPLFLQPLRHEVQFVQVDLVRYQYGAIITLNDLAQLFILAACGGAEVIRHLPRE